VTAGFGSSTSFNAS